MNELSTEKRATILSMICEGMSIRATARVVGVSKNTVTKLIMDVGDACSRYQDEAFRNLNSAFVESDEIWSFVGCKEANNTNDDPAQGSIWTWTALDADSKLIITWLVGDRSSDSAHVYLSDLASRLSHRIQLSTDGWKAYSHTVRLVFGTQGGVDWGTIIKTFGGGDDDHRYSPAECSGSRRQRKFGNPDLGRVNTSYVERQNLSIRMGSRRYTRLTNAFSKKIENHCAATALHFAFYNLCRDHGTLNKKYGTKTTPAMAAGVEDHVWTAAELVGLLDRYEAIAA
ncbi:MAG: helix-turn-helix domain-containing protein [Actinomycetota bacterium]|nr:helix-turn-helix domain-containing protein [Actinomycetota bacterium]